MTLKSGSRASDGLVRVRLWRAEETRWVGSLTKCLADMVVDGWSEMVNQYYRDEMKWFLIKKISLINWV